jgi:sucrose phosphorylase
MKNKVQLATYVDRLGGGGIAALRALLSGPLAGLFGAVHLLPFYDPIDGADAGFDPIDHTQVDPRLGSWHELQELASCIDIMADVIVNHISDRSEQFLDYLRRGSDSPFSGLFLTEGSVFPRGAAGEDVAAIYRPRPGAPFVKTTLQTGDEVTLWATFTPHQLDIDVHHPVGKEYLEGILTTLARNGVTMVRLDAVGYAVKKPGTSCFMLPETFDFIEEIAAYAKGLGIETLVEMHGHFSLQMKAATRGCLVYDFALPPLVLHAFAFGTARYLKDWIRRRPNNTVTVLDTHDGIGMVDIGAATLDGERHPGLVPPDELEALVEHIHTASAGQSRRATGAAASNLDLYQVNCTFFDAMGRDERRYVLARAIQFFMPGVPQIYYVGLLAGSNDIRLLERTGVGRDINRHYYGTDEIKRDLTRAVVRDLIALIRLRNDHPAFSGAFTLADSDDQTLSMRWQKGADFAELRVSLATTDYQLRYSTSNDTQLLRFSSNESAPLDTRAV